MLVFPNAKINIGLNIVEKRPDEPASEWLKRARRLLQDGRSRHGRSRVYR